MLVTLRKVVFHPSGIMRFVTLLAKVTEKTEVTLKNIRHTILVPMQSPLEDILYDIKNYIAFSRKHWNRVPPEQTALDCHLTETEVLYLIYIIIQ